MGKETVQGMNPKIIDLSDDDALEGQAMQLWVDAHGSRVAAWLIAKHRDQLLARGRVRFRIAINKQTPAWFRVGIEKLKQSPKRWAVAISQDAITRAYEVQWLQWRTFSRQQVN